MPNSIAAAAVIALGAPLAGAAIELRLYSEFQRADPFGRILAADRAAKPREILSPALVRNAYASFQVVVTGEPKDMYFLAVQSNPDGLFQWKLYEEKFAESGDAWIPDALEEVKPPYFGVLPDPAAAIAGQTTRVYLLDVWTPPDAPVGRVRLEVLIKTDYWRVAPMEVRIQSAVVPELPAGAAANKPLPPLREPADAAARQALEGDVSAPPRPATLRDLIRRNAMQDAALMRLRNIRASPPERDDAGAEAYLRFRDRVYREASL
jgi:hypothetical protein